MSHITDDEIADLPEEPSAAFVAGEKIMRDRLNEAIHELDQGDSTVLTLDYMNNVIALAEHFEITEIAEWRRAVPGKHSWMDFRQFIAEVDACTMSLRLNRIRALKNNSVALDADAKTKLRQMLNHIRETVDKLDISVAKKEALYKRISALQSEIDRDRTRYEALGALIIEAADDMGEAAKRLEPVVRMIERVGAALGVAKRAEDAKPKLPPRREPKRIEDKRQDKKNGFDEIPF